MLSGLRSSLLRAATRRPLALVRGFHAAVTVRSGAPAVSAAMVKALRDRTGAGMMDCKAALIAAADAPNEAERMTRAAEWLRKKGVSTAQKKSGRLAAQGLVGVTVDASGARAAAVEINSETDFVARNAQFQRLVSHITLSAMAMPHSAADPVTGLIPAAALSAAPLWNNPQRTVGDAVTDAVAAIKENLQIRRAARLHVQPNTVGAVFGYVHSPVDAPAEPDAAAASDPHELKAVTMGRIGSLVSLAARTPVPEPAKTLAELGAGLTMHVVASAPAHLSRAAVPAEAIAKERELIRAAALAEHAKKSAAAVAAGKPAIPEPKAAALDKMVDGKLKKWLTEQVLLEQTFVSADAGAETVEKVLAAAGVDVKGFARFAVGEGLNPISAGTAAAN